MDLEIIPHGILIRTNKDNCEATPPGAVSTYSSHRNKLTLAWLHFLQEAMSKP